MKIFLLTYEYPPFHGGVAAYLFNLMNAAPKGVEVAVSLLPKNEHWIITAWRQYFKVRNEKPDIIAVSHVLPAGYIAFKIRFWFKTPYIIFTHGTDILSARKSRWKRFWMRFVLHRAKFVVANSRFTAGLLKEEGITKIEIIPPGIVIASEAMQSRDRHVASAPRDDGNTIISIGRLVPRKGFDTLIKVMPAIIKEVPDAKLTIIGRGNYFEELDRLAHELRVETFVEILTDADDALKAKLLSKASLFTLPARQDGSDIEGFGIVTLEASAAGLPVVVGNSGGAAEPVVNGVTGIVIEPDSSQLLAEAIIRLLKNPDEAQKMGVAGREYVSKEYSIDVIAKRFWSIVQRS